MTAWSGSIWRHGPGGSQYRYFRSLDRPQYDLCARLDVTRFCAFMKARGGSSYHAMGYFVVRAANGVPAFRMRIREGPAAAARAGQPLLHRAARGRRALQVRRGRVVRGPRRVPAPLRRGVGAAGGPLPARLGGGAGRLPLPLLPAVGRLHVGFAGGQLRPRRRGPPHHLGEIRPRGRAGDNAAFGDGAPRLLRRHPCGAVFRRAPADAGRALNPDIHPCEGRDPHAASGARRRGERGAEL